MFREGDRVDTCYVVRSGTVRAVREHHDGRSITLAHFRAGEIFGELAMFEGDRRSATVETLEATEALAILAADMRRLLERHPSLAIKLIGSLGRRLRHSNERLVRQSFQTVPGRVASVLSSLASGASGEVLITSTQAELAQLADSSREPVSRFLAVLERAGIITHRRGKLIVHDPAALERYTD